MSRAFAVVYLTTLGSVVAQTPSSSVGKPTGAVVYAIFAAKPNDIYFARTHHMEGSGVFQLHIRAEGVVSTWSEKELLAPP